MVFSVADRISVFFTIAGCIWMAVSALNHSSKNTEPQAEAALSEVDSSPKKSNNYLAQIGRGVINFGESIYLGAKLVFGNRRFICA